MSALLVPGGVAPTAPQLHPETSQAALPAGERPDHRGGAEGTRTPDPHTARAAMGGSRRSTEVRSRSSKRCAVVQEHRRTALNRRLSTATAVEGVSLPGSGGGW